MYITYLSCHRKYLNIRFLGKQFNFFSFCYFINTRKLENYSLLILTLKSGLIDMSYGLSILCKLFKAGTFFGVVRDLGGFFE